MCGALGQGAPAFETQCRHLFPVDAAVALHWPCRHSNDVWVEALSAADIDAIATKLVKVINVLIVKIKFFIMFFLIIE